MWKNNYFSYSAHTTKTPAAVGLECKHSPHCVAPPHPGISGGALQSRPPSTAVPSSLVAGTCYEYSDTFGGLFQFPGAGGAVSICSQPSGLRPSERATGLWPLPSKVAVACVCSRGKDGVHGGDCDFHRDLPRETGTGRPGRGTESRHRVPRLWGQSNWKPTQSFRVHPLLPFLSIA